MKFVGPRPYADPEVAARKPVEIANSVDAVLDDGIHSENGRVCHCLGATVSSVPGQVSST
jgi:hypothetical protein